MALIVVALLAAGLVAWLLTPQWQAQWRERRALAQPFPPAWRRILRRHVPYVARLPADRQQQLKRLMQVFIAEVPFIGCRGLEVNDTMRVVVAAQACLLLLGRPQPRFAGLRQVLMYPAPFWVNRRHSDESGVLQEHREVLAGESWGEGQVILSWPDCLAGAAQPGDGLNLVIHEFAHQLDQDNGPANGAPPGLPHTQARAWAPVFQAAYDRLCAEVDAGHEDTLIDPYGTTSPAEFFAVVCELFYEQPRALAEQEPQMYGLLCGFFGVDPRAWSV